MVEWPKLQNELLVFGCVGSQSSKGKFLYFSQNILLLRILFHISTGNTNKKLESVHCSVSGKKINYIDKKRCILVSVYQVLRKCQIFFNIYQVENVSRVGGRSQTMFTKFGFF